MSKGKAFALMITAVAVIAGFVAPASPAGAAEVDPGDVVRVTLDVASSPATTSAATSGFTAKTAPSTSLASVTSLYPAGSTCRTISGTQTGYGALGDVLWTHKLTATWCWASGKITYRYSESSPSTSYAFWSYHGVIADSTSQTPYIRYQKVQFDHCIGVGWFATCNYDYPWIRLTMNTNGTYKIEGGV